MSKHDAKGSVDSVDVMVKRAGKLFKRETAREAVGLTVNGDAAELLGSWLGSASYVSPDGVVTVRDTAGHGRNWGDTVDPDSPLVPLVQLRLEDVPVTRETKQLGLPKHGLLQFFVGPDDDYGMMEKHYLVRHVTIPEDADDDWVAQHTVKLTVGEYRKPGLYTTQEHMGGYALTMKTVKDVMTSNDYRFDTVMDGIMDKLEVPAEHRDAVYAAVHDDNLPVYDDAMLAGYSLFTQTDPRSYSQNPDDERTLLSMGTMHSVLTWGDHGYADYLAPLTDLRNHDYTRTNLIWDCS